MNTFPQMLPTSGNRPPLSDEELQRLAALLQQRGEGLAAINPGEASLLKALGGSGEPIAGTQGLGVGQGPIKSYDDDDDDDDDDTFTWYDPTTWFDDDDDEEDEEVDTTPTTTTTTTPTTTTTSTAAEVALRNKERQKNYDAGLGYMLDDEVDTTITPTPITTTTTGETDAQKLDRARKVLSETGKLPPDLDTYFYQQALNVQPTTTTTTTTPPPPPPPPPPKYYDDLGREYSTQALATAANVQIAAQRTILETKFATIASDADLEMLKLETPTLLDDISDLPDSEIQTAFDSAKKLAASQGTAQQASLKERIVALFFARLSDLILIHAETIVETKPRIAFC